MTFPVVAARTATDLTSGVQGSHSVNLGAFSAGDLLVVVSGFVDTASAPVINTSVSGTGWRQELPTVAASQTRSRIYWKVADGGDALTLQTVDQTYSNHYCYCITGHAGAVEVELLVQNTAGTNADPPSATLTGAAQDMLALAAIVFPSNVVASGAPASYGTLTNETGALATVSISIAQRDVNGTTENPGTFTSASSRYYAWTLLIPSVAITTVARTSQVAAELLSRADPVARVSQVAAELLSQVSPNVRVSQVAIEVVSSVTDAPASDKAIVGFFF